MAIIDIESSNKDLSWVLFKNAMTQHTTGKPFSKNVRKGSLYGWYTSDSHFRLWFKDGNGQSSFYKHLDNNYLNASAYNCPFTYCSMMAEMLSSTIRQQSDKDLVAQNSLTLSSLLITLPNVMDFFIHFFADKVLITKKLLARKIYEINFSGNVTLSYLTNLAQVFCLIQAIEDSNIYIDLSENALIKYATNLKAVEAPYFIIYLFLSRSVPDKESFFKVKPLLEKEGWTLNYGNTQKQRFDAIKKFTQGGKILHDIGCGELYYSRQFSLTYENIQAWDMDNQMQIRNSKFIEKKAFYNIELKAGFDSESASSIMSGDDILITEMLEHITPDEALKVLKAIKDRPFRRMIVTVPNKDFNQFYRLQDEFRHIDHLWEPTYKEIEAIMLETFGSEFKVQIKPIGDGINGIHVSTLIVIDKEST